MPREAWLDAIDTGGHGVAGHGPHSLLRRAGRDYPSAMTMTARRYGAQSMSAPLRDVLVKRPGDAFGSAFDDPARFKPTMHFGVEAVHRAWLNTEGLPEYKVTDNPATVERWQKAVGKVPD